MKLNRFTIIPEDKYVSVDGIGFVPVEFTIDADIHAVQWYGTHGEIEYKGHKQPNRVFTDYTEFQSILDAYKEAIKPIPPIEPTLDELKVTALSSIKKQLAESDYRALKFIDGSYTATEYEPYRLDRIALRERYNLIEACTTKEELEVLLKEM